MPRWVLRSLHIVGWLFLVVGALGATGHALRPDQAGTPELGKYGGWILDAGSVLLGAGALILRKRLLTANHRVPTRLDIAAGAGRDDATPNEERDSSLASWVDLRADRSIARSGWRRYRPRIRAALAVGCWLMTLATSIVMGALLDVPIVAWTIFAVAFSIWAALMLAAFVLDSRRLMRLAIWAGLAMPLVVTFVVVPLGVVLSE